MNLSKSRKLSFPSLFVSYTKKTAWEWKWLMWFRPQPMQKVRDFHSGIDEILDLEKISRGNGPFFSISSWRIEFSFLEMLSNVKILKKKFSKFEILKKILFHFSKEWDFANRFSFSSRFFTQCLFQFSWEIIFCSLGWFWPSVFCRKGKYFKKTVLCCWAIFWLQFTKALHGDYYDQESSLGVFWMVAQWKGHMQNMQEWDRRLTWLESEDQRRRRRDWFFYCIWYWLQ